jgi:hypothetical protein
MIKPKFLCTSIVFKNNQNISKFGCKQILATGFRAAHGGFSIDRGFITIAAGHVSLAIA